MTTMQAVRCEIVRWVADEPQPGWVEARLTDASDRSLSFFDKPPIFTDAAIHPSTQFPVPGLIHCVVIGSTIDGSEPKLVEVRLLDGASSDDGLDRFWVRRESLVSVGE